ncbi:MAG: DNA end-binding protein Ku [Candidatus Nitrosomirales archaeon]|jgi:DNA end-binding protein Ku
MMQLFWIETKCLDVDATLQRFKTYDDNIASEIMPRSIWNGSISFGLVNIPVKMYTAAEARLGFTSLCKQGHQLQYRKWCPVENTEVKWGDVKKGFRLTGDKFVVLEKEDFEKVAIKTTKTIDVTEFVETQQIDPLYVEKSYYLVPEESGLKAYSLFVEALSTEDKSAIGKVVMRDKEHLVALRSYKKGLVMHILHYSDEIKSVEELPELKNLTAVKGEELKLAQALIEKLTDEKFQLSKFKDTYTEALKKLIRAKAAGKQFVVEEEKPVEEAKSLMEALKASVDMGARRTRARKG